MMSDLERVGQHERAIAALFPDSHRHEGGAVLDRTLVVMAFTNRCGSSYFGEILRQTPVFGGFGEGLNHDWVAKVTETKGFTSFPDYISSVVAETTKNKPVFGIKASWDQLLMLSRWRITEMFPKFHIIHIQREDVIAQAVSLWIASQTRKWASYQTAQGDAPVFNEKRIARLRDEIVWANALIPNIAEHIQAPLTRCTYEDVLVDPRAHAERVAQAVGHDLGAWQPGKTKLEKQGDALNEDFIARFRASQNAG